MENVLQQLNWVLLLSRGANCGHSSSRYRKAWRRLLTITSSLQDQIPNGLDGKLNAALETLRYFKENHDVAAINSLREFVDAVAAQSGNRISQAEAGALIDATQEIIEMLTAG